MTTETASRPLDRGVLDLDALARAKLVATPFPFVIVPEFIPSHSLALVSRDFPAIDHSGSYPVSALHYGPAFRGLVEALQGPAMARAAGEKLGLDLQGTPTMITVRGLSDGSDGRIHTDSRKKIVTVLIYMNEDWEEDGGRLRLLSGPDDLSAVVAEVPPARGTLLMFENQPNAWHGFAPFTGPRRVIQLNWVTSRRHAAWETWRHRLSAFAKSLSPKPTQAA